MSGNIVDRFTGLQRQRTGTPLKQGTTHLCVFIGRRYHHGREGRGKGEQQLDGDIECHKMPVQRTQRRQYIRRWIVILLPII